VKVCCPGGPQSDSTNISSPYRSRPPLELPPAPQPRPELSNAPFLVTFGANFRLLQLYPCPVEGERARGVQLCAIRERLSVHECGCSRANCRFFHASKVREVVSLGEFSDLGCKYR
jgi:hypothetical protein